MTPVRSFIDNLCRVCRVLCRVPCTPQRQQRRGFAPSVQGVHAPTCGRAGECVCGGLEVIATANTRARSKYPAHPAQSNKVVLNQWLKACMVVETLMHATLHTLHSAGFGGVRG